MKKVKNAGYPSYYTTIKNTSGRQKLVPFYKAHRLTNTQNIYAVGQAFYYGNILEKLGLALDQVSFTIDPKWELVDVGS